MSIWWKQKCTGILEHALQVKIFTVSWAALSVIYRGTTECLLIQQLCSVETGKESFSVFGDDT